MTIISTPYLPTMSFYNTFRGVMAALRMKISDRTETTNNQNNFNDNQDRDPLRSDEGVWDSYDNGTSFLHGARGG